MLPFEFVVVGIPVSHQTRHKARLQAWKQRVRQAALAEWPPGDNPEAGPVILKIIYYFLDIPLDVDNIVKAIQDALNGIVYVDDSQVQDVHSSKRNYRGSFTVRAISPALAKGFIQSGEFIHVIVSHAPNPQEVIK